MERKEGWNRLPSLQGTETSNFSLQLQSLLNVPSTKKVADEEGKSQHAVIEQNVGGGAAAVEPRIGIGSSSRSNNNQCTENIRGSSRIVNESSCNRGLEGVKGRREMSNIERSKPHLDQELNAEELLNFPKAADRSGMNFIDGSILGHGLVFGRIGIPADLVNIGACEGTESAVKAFPGERENNKQVASRFDLESAYSRRLGVTGPEDRNEVSGNPELIRDAGIKPSTRSQNYEKILPVRPPDQWVDRRLMNKYITEDGAQNELRGSVVTLVSRGRELEELGGRSRRVGDVSSIKKQEVDMIISLCSSQGCPRSLQNCVKVFVDDSMKIEDGLGAKANFNLLSNSTKSVLNFHFIEILTKVSIFTTVIVLTQ